MSKLSVLVFVVTLLFISASAQTGGKPRIFITDSQSWETSGNAGGSGGTFAAHSSGGARPQTAEMWIFLMLQLIMTRWVGSPYILTYIGTPNIVRAYGAGTSPEQAISLINPGWIWLYLAPAVLALFNLMVSFPAIQAKVRQAIAHGSERT